MILIPILPTNSLSYFQIWKLESCWVKTCFITWIIIVAWTFRDWWKSPAAFIYFRVVCNFKSWRLWVSKWLEVNVSQKCWCIIWVIVWFNWIVLLVVYIFKAFLCLHNELHWLAYCLNNIKQNILHMYQFLKYFLWMCFLVQFRLHLLYLHKNLKKN